MEKPSNPDSDHLGVDGRSMPIKYICLVSFFRPSETQFPNMYLK